MDPTLQRSYARCRQLTRRHYENFPVVTILIPARLRRHMHALYAFARGVDDLGDELDGDRLAALDRWEEWLRTAFADPNGEPVAGEEVPWPFDAVRATARACGLPMEPFLRLIEANRRDQRQKRHETFEDLLDYCTCSADPVGRLVLGIFGTRDEGLYPLSDAVCTGLQLTNFWQDVKRDLEMGRIYLPGEDMTRFDVTEEELHQPTASENVRALIRFQVERTREFFERGRPLADRVGGRLGADLRLFVRGGEAILDAIAAQDHDVLKSRPVLTSTARSRLVTRTLFEHLTGGPR